MLLKEKLAFVESYDFSTLVATGQHSKILRYVRICKCLSSEEECALIRRGNHEEIMAYIAHHYFDIDGMNEFIQRGKPNEVRFYFSRNYLYLFDTEAEWAEIMSISGILEDLISSFISQGSDTVRHKVRESFECALLKTNEHVQIRFYLSRRQLTPKAEELLEKVGSAEDKLVYFECWKAEGSYIRDVFK